LSRYTALYLVAWSPTLWSVGYALLQTPSNEAPGNLGTDEEVPRPIWCRMHPADSSHPSWTCCQGLLWAFVLWVRAPAHSLPEFT